MSYKVLITASGLGQRLGEITKYINKSLVRVGKKPAISYIIEAYPEDVEIVITLRYLGEQVKDCLELAYPNRKFTFVMEPDTPPEGHAFSLGLSMLNASDHLQCPFIFQCCDTIIEGDIPEPTQNWNGVCRGEDSASYSSLTAVDNHVQYIKPKGASHYDYLHIGLVGINDYEKFWDHLKKIVQENPMDSSTNDCQVVNTMLKEDSKFKVVPFRTWHDTGNIEGLNRTRRDIHDHFDNLDKLKETLFLFDDFALKFFSEKEVAQNRITRAKMLKGLVPDIEETTDHFYRYTYANGDLFSRVATPTTFEELLNWAKEHLWLPNNSASKEEFKELCHKFYYDKTVARINDFLESTNTKDQEDVINGETVPPIKEMLEKIDFDWLSEGEPSQFHGDFILDNIVKTKDGFCLLDWRQDFGGHLESGDMYYDLAKLNHNLVVSHDIVYKDLFTIEFKQGKVHCDILRRENLVQCQAAYRRYLKQNGYDIDKVQLLTALIWLNMSPLHHYPFNIFLFYFGKLNLWRELQRQKKV
jgi:choline kinase